MRVAVARRRLAVRGPAGVRHTIVRHESLAEVDRGVGNVRAERLHLADLLEDEHIAFLVPVDRKAGTIVPAVLQARECIHKHVEDLSPILYSC